jgi:hypothetical protein
MHHVRWIQGPVTMATFLLPVMDVRPSVASGGRMLLLSSFIGIDSWVQGSACPRLVRP